MKFRTEIEVGHGGIALGIDRPVVAVGSCFADNICARMRGCLWDAATPLGVLFNPLSIRRALELVLLSPHPEEEFADSLFESGGLWHSWLFDSSFSAPTWVETLNRFRAARDRFRRLISAGNVLSVTFGTAWCYFLKEKGSVVANCHKQNPALFERRRIDTEAIAGAWRELLASEPLKGCDIIFTVSPVRHVRDGLHQNFLSKATLMLAVERLCDELDNCHYFPAFEIVNDDLRDYRFYADDLVHPSPMAVEYIWQKFQQTFVCKESIEALREGESIARRLAHRPIITDSVRDTLFRQETERMLADFAGKHPLCIH